MLHKFESAQDARQLAEDLATIQITPNSLLIPDKYTLNSTEGKNVLKEVQVRQNQHVFRKCKSQY